MGYITLSLQHWTQLPLDRVYNQDFFLKIHLELGFKVHFFFFFISCHKCYDISIVANPFRRKKKKKKENN